MPPVINVAQQSPPPEHKAEAPGPIFTLLLQELAQFVLSWLKKYNGGLCWLVALGSLSACYGQDAINVNGVTRHCGLVALPAATRTLLMAGKPQAAVPPAVTVTFEDKAPPVEDQDGQNSCAAHAGCHAAAARTIADGKPDPRLAVSDLYQRVNHGRDAGADLNDVAFQLSNSGCCSLDFAPHLGVTQVAEKAGYLASRAANRPASPAVFCGDEAALLNAVESKAPAIIGVFVRRGFTPDAAGWIGPPRGRPVGGHAVLVCGVRPHGLSWDYRIQNSWGAAWGQKGFAWLDHRWVDVPAFGAFAFPAGTPH